MSNFKKLLIPAIILVVLVGGYFIVTNLPEPEKEQNPDIASEKIEIYDFVKSDVAEFLIENNEGLMHFQYVTIQVEEETIKEDGTTETKMVDRNVWQALVPEGMKVNTSTVDNIVWNANTLKAQKIIEENPSDLNIYGLNDPVKLTFKMKDGTQHVLLVGNETPTGGSYYAKKESEPVVYTIGSYEGEKFVQRKFDLMSKDVYDEEITADQFEAISFTRKNQKVFDATVSDSKWWLTWPIDAEARYEHLFTIAESLSVVSVTKYIEEDATELAQYGLENPEYVFDYTVEGQQYKLSLGNRDQSGNAFYAMLNDNGTVFTQSESAFTFLDKPIEELVSSFIHLQNIKDVREMRVSFDGFTDISRIKVNEEDEDLSTYEFNGTLLTGEEDEDYISAFKKYYQGAIGLYVDKIVLDVDPILQNPDVVIEYTLNTGEKIKVELVSAEDDVYFYAFKNGQYTGMKVRKIQLESKTFNGLRLSRKNLLDELAKRDEQ